MRVLYVCHDDNYHIESWIPAMQKTGMEVITATLRPNTQPKWPQYKIEPLFQTIRYSDYFTQPSRLRQIIIKTQPDILFASFANTYGLLTILADSNQPLVIQTWSRDINADNSVTYREQWMNRLIGNYVLRKADGITTDGPHFKEELLKDHREYTSKTISTGWGIDTDFWDHEERSTDILKSYWKIDPNHTVFTSIRGVFWYYQPEIILPAIKAFLQHQPDVHFIIPTLGHPIDTSLITTKEHLQNHPRVTWIHSLLAKEKVRELWKMTDAYLSMPLFDGIAESVQEGMYMRALPILNPLEANKIIAGKSKSVEWLTSVSPTYLQLLESFTQTLNCLKRKSFNSEENHLNIRNNWSLNRTAHHLKSFFETLI